MALDAASNGNFTTNTEEEALTKIENLAASDNNHCVDYDRSPRNAPSEAKRMEELIARMEQLMKKESRSVSFCEDQDARNGEEKEVFQAELNYVNGQGSYNKGFNSNYRNHPNFSYRSNNVENPQDQFYPSQKNAQPFQARPFAPRQNNFSQGYQQKEKFQPNNFNQSSGFQGGYQPPYQPAQPSGERQQIDELKNMLHQFATGHSEKISELQQEIIGWKTEMNGKFESLRTHLKSVETQVAQNAAEIQRTSGTLPGKSDPNPRDNGKGFCNFMGTTNDDDTIEEDPEEDPEEYPEEDVSANNSEDDPMETSIETAASRHVFINISSDESLHDNHDEEAMSLEVHSANHLNAQPPPLQLSEEEQLVSRLVTQLKEQINNAKITKDLSEDRDVILDLVFEKITIEVAAKMISNAYYTRLLRRTATKLPDPGKFIIPVSIGGTDFKSAICDLGSSVNIMTEGTFNTMKIGRLKRQGLTIVLADGSRTRSHGIAEGVTVRVGKLMIPTDFWILRYEKEPPNSIILGRPFLKTGGALIDVMLDTIQLRVGGEEVTFDMKKQRAEEVRNEVFMISAIDKPPDITSNQNNSSKRTSADKCEPP